MKNLLILGSTGSIGVNTLKIVEEFPDLFSVEALTAESNIDLLEKQIEKINPKIAVVVNEKRATELKNRIKNKCEVLSGENSLVDITKQCDYDILVSALVGFAGLAPTIEGIRKRKRIICA